MHHLVGIHFYFSLCKSKEYVREGEDENAGGIPAPHAPTSLSWLVVLKLSSYFVYGEKDT